MTQSTRQRLCSFTAGLVLALLTLTCTTIAVAQGRSESGVLLIGWVAILLDVLLCAWFTCSLVKSARAVARESGATR